MPITGIMSSSRGCPPMRRSSLVRPVRKALPMDNQSSEIEVRDVTRAFGEIVAVDHLSFSVRRGEIFGLVGPDGAGKTTTMRMLAGILAPDSGSISVAGCDVLADPETVKN